MTPAHALPCPQRSPWSSGSMRSPPSSSRSTATADCTSPMRGWASTPLSITQTRTPAPVEPPNAHSRVTPSRPIALHVRPGERRRRQAPGRQFLACLLRVNHAGRVYPPARRCHRRGKNIRAARVECAQSSHRPGGDGHAARPRDLDRKAADRRRRPGRQVGRAPARGGSGSSWGRGERWARCARSGRMRRCAGRNWRWRAPRSETGPTPSPSACSSTTVPARRGSDSRRSSASSRRRSQRRSWPLSSTATPGSASSSSPTPCAR